MAPKKKVTDQLRTAYAMELETAINYLANSIHLDGIQAQEIKEELVVDIQTEIGHAQALGNRIKQLGGALPGSLGLEWRQKNLQPPAQTTDVIAVVKGVIEGERAAIAQYDRIIQETDGKDYVTQDLAVRLKGEEEAHLVQFVGFLKELEAD